MDGRLHGKGMRRFKDGQIYKGSWDSGVLVGLGEYENESGGYKGGFVNNLEHGSGVKKFSDGTIYEGQWKGGVPHGSGFF